MWVLFLALVFTGMNFVDSAQEERVVGLPDIHIKVFEDMLFLTKDDVLNRLRNRNMIGEEMTYGQTDLEKIEKAIADMPEVRTVEVYSYLSGEWEINLSLREPIARIFNVDGSGCYLDKDGKLMPLSENYTAHVLTINGHVNETDFGKTVDDIINNDSLKTIEILDDLYAISNYVCSDEFLSAQITSVYVNTYQEFEMIPRVGDQRIMFGDASYLEGKFKKLEYFYKEGISRAGWENYDTITVMYLGQVNCSKRN